MISGETPTNASPDAGHGLGAGLTSLQGKYPFRALVSGTRSTPVWCRCCWNPSKLPNTKVLSFLDRPAQRDAILVALKARSGTGIEEVARVQGVISQEFVQRPMELV